MSTRTLRVERTGQAWIQDLGRPGYASIGVPGSGAADQHAARTAQILVANPEDAPLIEVTGSELTMTCDAEVLVSVTGAADEVRVNGHRQPSWQPLHLDPGARLSVPPGRHGLRSYVAVNGALSAEPVLGSVAPDPLLGAGRRLENGDRLVVDTGYRSAGYGRPHARFFRLPDLRPNLSRPAVVDATPGPELDRMTRGAACLDARYEVSAQSDQIGLRLLGETVEQKSKEEILSRGVPVGAIEVPPTGGVIVLLRGRLVTAGYPVVAVTTSASLDRLGQLRPGDTVGFSLCDVPTALQRLRQQQAQRLQLAERVQAAFGSSGLGGLVDTVRTRGASTRVRVPAGPEIDS
jgi:5-oxoprolinase (ATP-hydrolysing) subunit C